MNAAVEQMGSDTTAMRPFRVEVPEADLTDLRRVSTVDLLMNARFEE